LTNQSKGIGKKKRKKIIHRKNEVIAANSFRSTRISLIKDGSSARQYGNNRRWVRGGGIISHLDVPKRGEKFNGAG